MKKNKEDFTPAKKVNWFSPKMLFKTALKAYISSTFGNYADRREMEAALTPESNKYWEDEKERYFHEDELWIDFMSDTGDGFNATYSLAKLLAADSIEVDNNGNPEVLKRGRILILGGDQIYPSPTAELYEQKFQKPFALAFPEESVVSQGHQPHLYAIPGNHDWYDGLGNFIKIFCQQRTIGKWQTFQRKSYFALRLPNNYWLWATDIQLNADIDKPQLDYFRDIGDKMPEGDKIILVTAEPSWVYHQLYWDDKSYDRLKYFIEKYITCRKFSLKVMLTGDLHHYSYYKCPNNSFCEHLVGAGGGGAFMHFTHNLPLSIDLPWGYEKEKDLLASTRAELRHIYPRKAQSKRLNWKNLLFVALNPSFCFMMGIIYLLFFWIFETRTAGNETVNYGSTEICFSISALISIAGKMVRLPVICTLTILIAIGFFKFTDFRVDKIQSTIAGVLHALIQLLFIYLTVGFFSLNIIRENSGIIEYVEAASFIFFTGWVVSGTVMGVYLFATNLFLKIHLDESSSAIAWTGYKNFLRMKINKDGFTIYPIGIEKVSKWRKQMVNDKVWFNGKLPKVELISEPIEIK